MAAFAFIEHTFFIRNNNKTIAVSIPVYFGFRKDHKIKKKINKSRIGKTQRDRILRQQREQDAING